MLVAKPILFNVFMTAPIVTLTFIASFFSGCTKCSTSTQNVTPTQAPSATPVVTQPADSGGGTSSAAPAGAVPASNEDLSIDASGLSKAVVVMKTSKGTIKFKLYPKDAPMTARRFVELVKSKFFNGLAFHRVVPSFVIQTGDPKSKNKSDPLVGTGGSGQKLKAEFNSRKHVRGAVAMARSADPDSADSQFYICLGSFPHLDNQYTVIGQVIDYGEKVGGKDVLDRTAPWDEVVEMSVE